MTSILDKMVDGISTGGYESYILPKGLKQNESCMKCEYGGDKLTVNFCKRPKDQQCNKIKCCE